MGSARSTKVPLAVGAGSTPNLGLIGMLESQGNADRSNSINSSGLNFTTWFFFAAPGMLINNLLAYVWLQVRGKADFSKRVS